LEEGKVYHHAFLQEKRKYINIGEQIATIATGAITIAHRNNITMKLMENKNEISEFKSKNNKDIKQKNVGEHLFTLDTLYDDIIVKIFLKIKDIRHQINNIHNKIEENKKDIDEKNEHANGIKECILFEAY